MVGNHSGIISEYFIFQCFEFTNFFAVFLILIYFSYVELTLNYLLVFIMERVNRPILTSVQRK